MLKKNLKICMLTTNPVDTDSRVLNEVVSLAKLYQVTVLARDYKLGPAKKKLPFYLKRVKYQRGRVFLFSILSSLYALTRAAWQENPDVYHAHDLDGLLCAFLPALLKRKTLIYDSHELWSDLTKFSNLRGIHWLLPYLEKLLMLKVKRGITVNDSLAKHLTRKYHKPFLSLYNYPDLNKEQASPYDFKKLYPGQKILLYLGNTIGGRGVEEAILALKYLAKNIILVILSDSPSRYLQALSVREKVASRVYFLPAVLPSQVIAVTRQADLGLALIQYNSLSYYLSSPNKLFQYMAAEIPILGSNFPEFKKFILQNKIGEVINPRQIKSIAAKIEEMMRFSNQKKYRRNLRDIARHQYNWDDEQKKLLTFYRNFS